MGKLIKFLRNRITILVIAILLQLAIFVFGILFLSRYVGVFYSLMLLLSTILVISIMNDKSNPSYKLAWIIPIMLFPVFGGVFYALFGRQRASKKERSSAKIVYEKLSKCKLDAEPVMQKLLEEHPDAWAQSAYILGSPNLPPFANSQTTFYPVGEKFFEALKQDLANAQEYIFMEYFIIGEGKMWGEILEILKERAKAGVKVRLMYDDFGCLLTLPHDYHETLRGFGIEVAVFNPLKPLMSLRYNTRDHRKMTVIDGRIAYTGGCNLADEYINVDRRFGHWKDNGIRIEGEAAAGLGLLFLSLWDFVVGIEEDYTDYQPKTTFAPSAVDGTFSVVQPFTDNPSDGEPVGARIYMNMLNRAKRYVYIKTPYLIIDNEMITSLSLAAKSGVDVRIVTPGVADKKTVYLATRSYYAMLLESGVRIYEYTPGFMHEKVFLSDDIFGVVGTVNLDYRSLYLHYECGVWMYKGDSLQVMKEDFDAVLKVSREVKLEDCQKASAPSRFVSSLLRFFAPLM